MRERILEKQQELQKSTYIPRHQVFDLGLMKLKKIISTVGPRRSGKTTYMLQIIDTLKDAGLLQREQVVYIDFNDHIGGAYDFEMLLSSYKSLYPDLDPIFFFDEIQEVENLRTGVFFLYNFGYQIFMTGSNSKILSSELSTHFRGKSFDILMGTLDFPEYLSFRGYGSKSLSTASSYSEYGKLVQSFQEYLTWGGYPEIVLSAGNTSLQTKLIKTYMDVMIYKDLMEKYAINDEYVLKFMIQKMIASHTKQVNINKLYNELVSNGRKKNKSLLYEIFDHMQSVFFIDTLHQQYKKQGFKKVYVLDNVYQTVYQTSNNLGQKFENIIYRYFKKQEMDIRYSKDPEIDFIDQSGKKYQVCRERHDQNHERETRNLGGTDVLIYGLDKRSNKEKTHFQQISFDEFLLYGDL